MAGHITKRKKNGATKWRARYPDPSYGGKKEIERTFDRKIDAERWLRNQQVALDRGDHIAPSSGEQPISSVVTSWRSTWIDLEPKTKAGYESILNKHVLPRWKDTRTGAVDAASIQAWVNELALTRTRTTVVHIYNVLHLVMEYAVALRLRSDNPCSAVKLPSSRKEGKREMLFLTPAEIGSLADAITPRFKLMVYVSGYIGLRAGEVEALRRKDIDLLHSRLTVTLALKDVNTSSDHIADEDKGLIFGPPKNGKTREVVIPKFMKPMFEEQLAADEPPSDQGYPAVDDNGDFRWTRDPADPDRILFTSTNGHPVRHTNFYRRHFKPAVRRRYCQPCRAEVKKGAERCPECESTDLSYVLPPEKHGFRFHDLRHTCASILIAGGADAYPLMRQLGHQNIQTTYGRYGHMLPSLHKAMGASLDAAYAGSLGEDDEEDIPRIGRGERL
ncbi:MAG: tyrosine-type recombinase/integrase [Proteobacteria bacterium]|nr:tyrosine-type recombinase/integrase [Pseudomonadota bacterium]